SAGVIQFTHDCVGADVFEKPEFSPINALLKESQAGLSFPQPKEMTKYILRLRKSEGVERILHLLELLRLLTEQNYKAIDIGALENNSDSNTDSNRINVIMTYIDEKFKNDISLYDVSNVANLTPNTFCTFCKKLMRNNFVEMLVQYHM